MMAGESLGENSGGSLSAAQPIFNDLKPRPPHFPAKVKSVIFLFMEGGVSQVDSFDPKPMLEKYNGQDPRKAIGKLEKTQFANVGQVLKSPWKFEKRGQSGIEVSDLFPHIAGIMDETVLIRSMTSSFPEHTSATTLSTAARACRVAHPRVHGWAMVWERKTRICRALWF